MSCKHCKDCKCKSKSNDSKDHKPFLSDEGVKNFYLYLIKNEGSAKNGD